MLSQLWMIETVLYVSAVYIQGKKRWYTRKAENAKSIVDISNSPSVLAFVCLWVYSH